MRETQASGTFRQPSSSPLRIATLNIWNHTLNWRQRRPLVIGLLEQTGADVIALQEVAEDSGTNQAHSISELLSDSYSCVFEPTQQYRGEWSGNAVLSRLPVLSTHSIELTQDQSDPEDHFGRKSTAVVVRFEDTEIAVVTTHLSLSERARLRTIREVYAFANQVGERRPVVLTGDFNCGPESPPIRYVTGASSIGGCTGDFTDTWTYSRQVEPSATWPTDPNLVEKAWAERHPEEPLPWSIVPARMDYVFVRSGPEVNLSVLDYARVTREMDGLHASDHFGVWCCLDVTA